MKTLVVYFSRTGENSVNGEMEVITKGFTEIVAEKIAARIGADVYKLEPEIPYPTSYAECVKRYLRTNVRGNAERRDGQSFRLWQ